MFERARNRIFDFRTFDCDFIARPAEPTLVADNEIRERIARRALFADAGTGRGGVGEKKKEKRRRGTDRWKKDVRADAVLFARPP